MAAFEFTALDRTGKQSKGLIEGDTAKHVRQQLRERNLVPVAVAEVADRSTASKQPGRGTGRGMSASELSLVTRQLASLSQSGLPLEESLLAVSRQNDTPRTQSILMGVRGKVMEGHTLADGLGEFPRAFPDLYRATVAAGESSGHLDTVLERLADYTEARQELRQRIANAMIYPLALIGFAVAIIVFMLASVVPKIVGVFDSTAAQLPILTRGLIAVSDFVRDYWPALVAALISIVFGAGRLLKQEGPRRACHQLLLRLPLTAPLTRGINTARFTRTFSILAGSGVPVLEGMKISSEVIENLPMREAVIEAAERVREGASIAQSLATSKLFPPMVMHMIASGESSGRLEDMLVRCAAGMEREVDSLIATLLGLLQPLLVILMGLIVLMIVFAILLPIFEINNLIA